MLRKISIISIFLVFLIQVITLLRGPLMYTWDGLVLPWLVSQGQIPYRDYLQNRGFLSEYLIALLSFFTGGPSIALYKIVLVSIFCITAFSLFKIIKKLFGFWAGFISTFYFCLWWPIFNKTSLRPETFLGVFILFIFFAFYKSIVADSNKWMFVAGMISAISLFFKQNVLFPSAGLLFISCYILLREKQHKIKSATKLFISYILGALIPIIAAVFYFYKNKALYDFIYLTIVFPLTKHGKQLGIGFSPHIFLPLRTIDLMNFLLMYSIFIPFIFLLLQKGNDKREKFLLFMVFILFICIQAFNYPHYSLEHSTPILIPLSIMYGVVISKFSNYTKTFQLKENILSYFSLYKRTSIALIVFMVLLTGVNIVHFYKLKWVEDNESNIEDAECSAYHKRLGEVCSWISANINKNERIYVVGNRLIYYYSRRLPTSKYFYQDTSASDNERLLKDLSINRPQYIIFEEEEFAKLKSDVRYETYWKKVFDFIFSSYYRYKIINDRYSIYRRIK